MSVGKLICFLVFILASGHGRVFLGNHNGSEGSIETELDMEGLDGEEVLGEILFRSDPELEDACKDCVNSNKIFLRFNTTVGDSVMDYTCESEATIRKLKHQSSISHYVCEAHMCAVEYMKFPYSFEMIKCSYDGGYPQYVANVQRRLPGFDVRGLIRYVHESEIAWTNLVTSLREVRKSCFSPTASPSEVLDVTYTKPSFDWEKYVFGTEDAFYRFMRNSSAQ